MWVGLAGLLLRCQDDERCSWLDLHVFQVVPAFQLIGAHAVPLGDGKQGVAFAYFVGARCRLQVGAGEARLGNHRGRVDLFCAAVARHQ